MDFHSPAFSPLKQTNNNKQIILPSKEAIAYKGLINI